MRWHGSLWGDIIPSFCQISHTFDKISEMEILLTHNILKYLPQKINIDIGRFSNKLNMTIY